jgi:hypothetical protein
MAYRLGTICAVLVLLHQPARAADEIQLKWTELGAIAIGHDVRLALPGGAVLQGEIEAVRDDSLVMIVAKTSDRKAFPKGQNSIPRASVSVVELKKTGGISGRVVGTTTGAIGGLTISGEIIGHSNMSEGPAITVFLVATIGTTVAGYFAGRMVDRRVIRIRIAP